MENNPFARRRAGIRRRAILLTILFHAALFSMIYYSTEKEDADVVQKAKATLYKVFDKGAKKAVVKEENV